MTEAAKGVVAIVAACLIWGFATLYYKAMAYVPPLEVLSHRVLWTLLFFGAFLAVQGRFAEVGRLILGPKGLRVALAGSVIALNWGVFIWAIQAGYAVESSLGYYILPLVSVVMGVLLMGERLMPAQAVAVALAALAVLVLTYGMGVAPWIALILAFSFAPYLVLKKEMAAPAVVSVTAEVLVIAPLAVIWILGAHFAGWLEFGRPGGLWGQDLYTTLMLPVTGLISGLPLILLSWGAQRVRLSTLGVVQYLNPTLQAFSAVVVMGEPFTPWHGLAFGLIWLALAIYSVAAIRQERAARKDASKALTSATTLNSPRTEASAKP